MEVRQCLLRKEATKLLREKVLYELGRMEEGLGERLWCVWKSFELLTDGEKSDEMEVYRKEAL